MNIQNVADRFAPYVVAERLREVEAEVVALRAHLAALENALSWHGDDAAKGRALTVIAKWAGLDSPETTT